MPRVHSFNPIAETTAQVLILGSMPGQESLRAGQYYAHPRNAFWPIMGELYDINPLLPYQQRASALIQAGIALWDVLQSCERAGSLDSNIIHATLAPNDFRTFLRHHPHISHVFFNGAKAEACFRRYVLPHTNLKSLHYQRLPSTSPAHASMSYASKLQAWQVVRKISP